MADDWQRYFEIVFIHRVKTLYVNKLESTEVLCVK